MASFVRPTVHNILRYSVLKMYNNRHRSYHADEVDSQENLSSRLQGSAARFLSVHLPRPTGQNQEASNNGQRSGIHSYLQGNIVQAVITHSKFLLQCLYLIKHYFQVSSGDPDPFSLVCDTDVFSTNLGHCHISL